MFVEEYALKIVVKKIKFVYFNGDKLKMVIKKKVEKMIAFFFILTFLL